MHKKICLTGVTQKLQIKKLYMKKILTVKLTSLINNNKNFISIEN